MEALSPVLKKSPADGGCLWCGAGGGLTRAGSCLPARGTVRERRGRRRTQDGRWTQMPSTRLITTKLQLILTRKTETYTIYSAPRLRVSCTEFLSSLDCTLRWRTELCVEASRWKTATQHSSIMCVVGVLSWDFLLKFGLYHLHIHGT
jgi:hypothetical protein